VKPDAPLRRLAAALRGSPRLRPALAIAAAATVPFLGAVAAPPFLDDGWAALQNPLVWRLGNAGRIFRELYGFAGPPSVRGPYRPLTTLTYALDWALHGSWMPGWHLVNLALHAVASLLVAALAGRLARAAAPAAAPRIALLAGLLFAVHPAHIEAVVTVFGRTDLLATALSLVALLLALRAGGPRRAREGTSGPRPASEPRCDADGSRRRREGVLSKALGVLGAAAALAAAMLAKEAAVVVPALYLLVAGALPAAAGLPARPGLAAGAPRAALLRAAAVAGALTLAFVPWFVGHAVASPQGAALAVAPEARWFPPGTPAVHVALTMSRVLGEYLRILAFPSFLGGDFAYAARIPTLTGPTWGLALATLWWMLTLGAGVALLRRAPLAGVGLVWIFVALLPVSQLVPVGVLLAERLLYLPSVGFCLAAAAALALLPRAAAALPGGAPPWLLRTLRQAAWALPALLVALLLARTASRSLEWRSEVTYWEAEAEKAPHQVVVNNNLAVAYTARGEPEKAISRLEIALTDAPDYWRAWVNLGVARAATGDLEAARAAFQRAIELAPAESDPLRFLGRALWSAGDLPGAAEALLRARQLAPEQAALAREAAGVLLQAGRVVEGRLQLDDAIRLDPSDRAARAMLEKLR
jgi:tetratricopeptide (TPR) repeat protein